MNELAYLNPPWDNSTCLDCTSLSPDRQCLRDKPNDMGAAATLVYCPWKTTGTAQLSALQMMGEG